MNQRDQEIIKRFGECPMCDQTHGLKVGREGNIVYIECEVCETYLGEVW